MPIDRALLAAQNKGGCLKTSIVANLSGIFAERGAQVLAIDLDGQANLGCDLGYDHDVGNDDGASLLEAYVASHETDEWQPLEKAPLLGVRTNLDVIPAGECTVELRKRVERALQPSLGEDITARDTMQGTCLGHIVAPLAAKYDIVLVDCGPSVDDALTMSALTSCRWLMIPTTLDQGGRKGLEQLAKHYAEARTVNADLELVGVALTMVASERRSRHAGKQIAELLDVEDPPIFESTIRNARAEGENSRERGLLIDEVVAADTPEQRRSFLARLRQWSAAGKNGPAPTRSNRASKTALRLADDYRSLAAEIERTIGGINTGGTS